MTALVCNTSSFLGTVVLISCLKVYCLLLLVIAKVSSIFRFPGFIIREADLRTTESRDLMSCQLPVPKYTGP